MIEIRLLKPMYLAFLVMLTYFIIFTKSWVAIFLAAVALICLIKQYQKKTIWQTLLMIAVFSLYFVWIDHRQHTLEESLPSQVSELRLIPDSLSVDGDLLSGRAIQGQQTYQFYYQLQTLSEKKYFQALNQVVSLNVAAKVEKPVGQRNFKGFDYATYLKREGIYGIAQVTAITSVKVEQPKNPIEWVRVWRRQLLVHINHNFPAPMKHYMTGLLLGYLDKSFDEMSDIYTDLGIIHLFALSGMQVGFFIGIFRTFLLRLGVLREHFTYFLLPFSFLYAGLTGFTVSVVRSLLQAILGQFGFRKWDNLGLTIMIFFILSPHFLETVGGVLSFAYAFILSRLNLESLSGRRKAVVESLVLSFGILPLLIFYFGSFQPLSIILTACFSVIFDVLLLPLLSLVLLASPLLSLSFCNPLFLVLESVIKWTAQLSAKPLVFGSPSLVVLILILTFLAALHDFWKEKKFRYALLLASLCLFALTKNPLENEVTVMDVGQGDSILIRDMAGKTLLIDTGGRVDFTQKEEWRKRQIRSNAEKTSIPYLKSRGISTIDQLLITHTDTDHMGDLGVLAKHFKIKEILISPGAMTKSSFVKELQALKIKVRLIQAGDRLPIMGTSLHVLYPWSQGDGGNNDSLVLYGKLLDKRFLFTGDLEVEGEKALLTRYPSLPVDVLKAGHHGSKGSSDPKFLRHINATEALISAGLNNRYHHPNDETLERFDVEKMTVYRTDQEGAIRYRGVAHWKIETVR
ncbi:DNA internalization-related competence protein ComEC/Rec2 [Streptococcus jiangjianxini]|uniref:DNA internalization-related competence protein ComEC/Rec2 n=1 Tax=Streptococcus jiangjianxini TaxID=3161189 RepID=UPI0032F049F8